MVNPFTDDDDRESFRVVAVLVAMHGILSADPRVRDVPAVVADRAMANADAVLDLLDKEEVQT